MSGISGTIASQNVITQGANVDTGEIRRRVAKRDAGITSKIPFTGSPDIPTMCSIVDHRMAFYIRDKTRHGTATGLDMSVFVTLNYMDPAKTAGFPIEHKRLAVQRDIAFAGIVQTPWEPTKEALDTILGRRSTFVATDSIFYTTLVIGGTMTTLNTGTETIQAGCEVMWSVPSVEGGKSRARNEVTIAGQTDSAILAVTEKYDAGLSDEDLIKKYGFDSVADFKQKLVDKKCNYMPSNVQKSFDSHTSKDIGLYAALDAVRAEHKRRRIGRAVNTAQSGSELFICLCI